MAQYHNSLHNAQLKEGPLPAAEYNRLPHIDSMRGVAAKNASAHAHLLGLIASNNLSDIFSIHLIHKHFDVRDGYIMVYETIQRANQQPFIVSCPRKAGSCDARGLYFLATRDGPMQAYEYTTDPGADLGNHADFVTEFSQSVLNLGVETVFALTAKKINEEVMTEFELGDLSSTVLVNDASWLPNVANPEDSTTTDWTADASYAEYASLDRPVPGVVQLKCTTTRSKSHYNVTCSSTRSGKHYEQKPAFGPIANSLAPEMKTATTSGWDSSTDGPKGAKSALRCIVGRSGTHSVVDDMSSNGSLEQYVRDWSSQELYLGEHLLSRDSEDVLLPVLSRCRIKVYQLTMVWTTNGPVYLSISPIFTSQNTTVIC